MKKSIDTLMMSMRNYYLMFFCLIVFCLSIAALFIFLGFRLNERWLIIIGPLLSLTPAIIIRQKINLVAKKATIHFSDEFIEIVTPSTPNERFYLSNIQYFSVSKFAVDNASTINFTSRDGIKRRYIFFKQLARDRSVLDNVLFLFSSYNINKMQENKIQISPSFYLTKAGKIFVATIGFIILATIIIQVVYTPKSIPISLLAVLGGYLQVKVIQMNNKKILDKFRNEINSD